MPSLGPSASTPNTHFCPVLGPELTPVSTLLSASSPQFTSLPIGAHIKVSAASFQIVHKLSMLVSQGAGGSALVVDYGADHAAGNSFHVCPLLNLPIHIFHHSLQAFKGHAFTDPFDYPGQANLTTNIDLAFLAKVLKGTGTFHLSFV
jgi:NADH dehydrogenase [ubiquinone] 1 alpha subcomplex assembly factor 7